jgi:hypothetical protein
MGGASNGPAQLPLSRFVTQPKLLIESINSLD